ncbi:hypothetical protein H8D36_00940 [archaeon]|nr:hypothetical protein [archaeon]MBL7056678.1 hypothetical protein [Candidatus Woesearchaeota archaeon]
MDKIKTNWKPSIIVLLSVVFVLFLSSISIADECVSPVDCALECAGPTCQAVYGGVCLDLCFGAENILSCPEVCDIIVDEPEPEPEVPEDEIYSYDLISNAREWFACNASGQIDLLGDLDDSLNYVDEYDTFDPTYGYDEVNCLDYFNDNYWELVPEGVEHEFSTGEPAGYDPPEFVDCNLLETNEWCCYASASETNIGNCLSECFAGDENSFVSEYPNSDQQCEELGIGCDNPGAWWDVISGDFPKDVCGPWLACFGGLHSISPGLPCEDQGPSGSTQLCYGETPLCSGGTIINSSDTTADSVCCLGEAAECIAPIYEGDDCVLSGGVVCESASECFGQYDNGCCFGGDCIDIEITNSLDKEQSYICYSEQGNSKFAECCYEGKCDNEFKGKGYLFGRGVSLHTINNYDSFDTTEQSYKDYVTVKTASSDDDLDINIEGKFNNWENYEYFEFIFASNALFSFDELFVEYDDGTIESAGQVSDLLAIKDKNDFRWNYVILNLSTLTHVNSKEVSKITLTVKDGYSNVYAAFDNLILREEGDSDYYNSENYYCTGGFGTWIEDLDYSEDPAIALAAGYDEKRPHSYACNVQMAFDWTGNFCCGDDTRFNYGEFFNDDLAACFNGSFVPNDMTLANATNDYTIEGFNQHLLFYEGDFWVCGDNAYDRFDDYKYSYDGLEGSTNLINSENKVSFFENKGSWYCDPSGWLYLKDAKRLKIIAAKLLEMAGENDYSLHCGNTEDVMNLQEGYIPSEGFAQTDNFCVLETNGDVIIGTGVSKENMNQFLNINLKSFHPVYETDATTYTCDFDDADVFNATFFLRRCDQGNLNIWLNASYNPHFGILFFSLQKGEPLTGFLGFIVEVWENIVSFFENLFEGGTQSVEYVTVPKNATFGDFEELFIKQVGEKTIEAIREEKALVIKYKGFSDVTFLKDLTKEWFVEKGYEHYNITLSTISGNEQILGINGTTIDQFPWNYLTSNLKFE